MNNEIWTVSLDGGSRSRGTKDVAEIGTRAEGSDGGKVRGARVLFAAAHDGHLACLALVEERGE